ncbi:MAG: TetR family transcriptional regulator [Lachnospiraceae bacterium]|nr:TetR family transcriptional regulator [Lachnospiraceae bacterium]
MIKGTPELIAQRREEIINACEQLYKDMSFKDITLKEISSVTSFSRPTIYNYFETKEEIFLALFEREYNRWNEDLERIISDNEQLTRVMIAKKLAYSLEKRQQLLKLLSMNNYDMEANSRAELLTDFKIAYGKSISNVRSILDKFCPEMDAGKKQSFIYIFFPFMFGIYPYTAVTDRQKAAMTAAGVDYNYQSVYELTYSCLLGLFGEK